MIRWTAVELEVDTRTIERRQQAGVSTRAGHVLVGSRKRKVRDEVTSDVGGKLFPSRRKREQDNGALLARGIRCCRVKEAIVDDHSIAGVNRQRDGVGNVRFDILRPGDTSRERPMQCGAVSMGSRQDTQRRVVDADVVEVEQHSDLWGTRAERDGVVPAPPILMPLEWPRPRRPDAHVPGDPLEVAGVSAGSDAFHRRRATQKQTDDRVVPTHRDQRVVGSLAAAGSTLRNHLSDVSPRSFNRAPFENITKYDEPVIDQATRGHGLQLLAQGPVRIRHREDDVMAFAGRLSKPRLARTPPSRVHDAIVLGMT